MRVLLTWLTAILILFVAYGVIRFAVLFDANLCYSSALDNLASASRKVLSSGDPKLKLEFEGFVNHLPLAGYETDCSKVESATDLFLQHVNAVASLNSANARPRVRSDLPPKPVGAR